MQFNFLKTFFENFKDLNETSKIRANICNECNKRNFGICTECKCFLEAKIRIPMAKCPLNKW
jgi:hypothetical protein